MVPGVFSGAGFTKGLVIALREYNNIPYISARTVLDAMRNRDAAHRKVGVSVHNGELVLCGRVFLGDSAFAKHDEYGEAAMPGSEKSSSSKHWPEGQDENTERELVAQTGHQLVASPEETKTESKEDAEAEQPPTSAGESGPEDQAADTDTEWEGDENENNASKNGAKR